MTLARLPMYFSSDKAQERLGYRPGPVTPALARAVGTAGDSGVEGKGGRMKFPLRSTVQIGRYVASQKGEERYPLVLMLEPTLGCNIACIGCGKIREYESNKARLTVEECLDSGAQCRAPVVSICGGEPLIYKGIEDVVGGLPRDDARTSSSARTRCDSRRCSTGSRRTRG